MTNNSRHLILTLVRFQYAVDAAHERMVEGAEMDHAFDAGEFSGPAHWSDFMRAQDDIALRFGFANADVAYEVARTFGALTREPLQHLMPGEALPLPDAHRCEVCDAVIDRFVRRERGYCFDVPLCDDCRDDEIAKAERECEREVAL